MVSPSNGISPSSEIDTMDDSEASVFVIANEISKIPDDGIN